jgi:polyribonucleotide nucleotidyltransferase
MVINPTRSQMKESDMDFIIAATEKNIMMVEGESKECSEADLIKAIEAGHNAIRLQVQAQKNCGNNVVHLQSVIIQSLIATMSLNAKIETFAKDKVYQLPNQLLLNTNAVMPSKP